MFHHKNGLLVSFQNKVLNFKMATTVKKSRFIQNSVVKYFFQAQNVSIKR